MKGLSRRLLAAAALGLVVPAAAQAAGPAGGRAPNAEVTGVSVLPTAGRAEVVIAVRGSVEVKDFTLRGPERLVLDISGARLSAPAVRYDGVSRAGVSNVRYNQFSAEVVRVVLELDAARPYKVERSADAVRIVLEGAGDFAAWSSGEARGGDATDQGELAAVTPVRPAATAYAPAYAAPAVEPRITVTWDNASIADVVAGFAAFSGRTIILGKDVKGNVTAEIKNQPWPQAFAAILATQGLTAQEMPGGIIRVDAPSTLAALDSLEPLETRVVRINYKQAGTLSNSVASVLTKGRGRVVADTSSNALIITDTRSRIETVADFVRGLDVRTPQVSIQSKIIFVDRTRIEQLGVKYDLGSSSQFFNKIVQRTDPTTGKAFDKNTQVVDLGGNQLSAISNADATISGSALDLVFSTAIGGFKLTSFLSALERVDLSDIQAEPTISTVDNRQADILVGDEIPVRVLDASSAGGGANGPRATVQFKQTGIRLTVTPHVTNNGQILMDLATERSAVREIAAGDLGYTIQTQKASNQLLVNDGETAVIGGLTVTQVTKSRQGIPLLSGLPIVGKLFSFSNDQENRRDLIILVTPRVIDDGVSAQ
ncbi:MAG TPA: AMIN domain-containing protein [Gemmatimonadales bacterium]|nr:AMIN domain-containing protein [Gemmatimonadales bacterium]